MKMTASFSSFPLLILPAVNIAWLTLFGGATSGFVPGKPRGVSIFCAST